MRKKIIFCKNGAMIYLPGENKIMNDAKMAFPRHPLYKDVNKKYREGYIRGQVDLINYMQKQLIAIEKEHTEKSDSVFQSGSLKQDIALRKLLTVISQLKKSCQNLNYCCLKSRIRNCLSR